MSEQLAAAAGSLHPSPHRARVGRFALFLGLLAAPAAWGAHAIAEYALASHACFPGDAPLQAAPAGWENVWTLLLIINLAALAAALVGTAVSFRNWRVTRGEASGERHGERQARELVEGGEGRTRFLSLWGIATGVGFAVAILFDTIALFGVPLCGS